MNSPVITVSQLNAYVKSIIDGDENLQYIYVCGEISNFTNHYRTGHFYMVLKDADASIKAVMFRSSAQRLRFAPEDGMMVIAKGRLSVYERSGQYQLYIDDLQPDGAGALSVAFEQLKERLAKQGLFDDIHKKPIPAYPERIGVITSPTGAAVHDILNVLERRFPLSKVVLCPVQVQGESAAPQISDAIKRFNRGDYADLLIVGRGGGSLEDLWAFNEEIVARAVFESEVPIISAVGHETDFTICDFVADLRAPTPSAAAELAVPNRVECKERINYMNADIINYFLLSIEQKRQHILELMSTPFFKDPAYYIETKMQVVDELVSRITYSMEQKLQQSKSDLSVLCGKLDVLSPLKVLGRGYSLTVKNKKIIGDINDVDIGDSVTIMLSNGALNCDVISKADKADDKNEK